MRALFLITFSAAVLSGCLTTQENPNYEHSTAYREGSPATQQYASTAPTHSTVSHGAATHNATYHASSDAAYLQTVPSIDISEANFPENFSEPAVSQVSYETAPAYPVYAHSGPTTTLHSDIAPTDSAYAASDVTGTPGYMAMQNETGVQVASAPSSPATQIVETAPLGAAGTPVAYDYSRNIITADVETSGQSLPETVRLLQGSGQSYIVQPGDTVYSLSRKSCVGVNVIQSMNGLDGDYGIKIGQSLRLPASVC